MDQTEKILSDEFLKKGYIIRPVANFEAFKWIQSEIQVLAKKFIEETKELDGKETFKYFKDELGMDEMDAWERTEEQGKDPSGKKDAKSPYKKDKNFVTRATLSEIQRQKAIKMLEDILMKQKNSNKSDVLEKEKEKEEEKEVPNIIKKNLSTLLKQMEKQGMSKKDLIKIINRE